MDIEKEQAFFDEFQADHGEYDVLGEGAYRRLLDLFEARVRPVAGERLVDLGCGTGAFTRRLRKFGLHLTGMDISAASIARASRSAGPHETYVVGDNRATGLPAGSVDIISYSGVLHHFDTHPMRVEVLSEGRRLLRPGGRLFAYDPSATSPSMFLYRDPRSPLYSSKGKTQNEVLLDRHELAAELREAGFERIEIQGTSGITFRWVDSGVARFLLPIYNLYEQVVRLSPFEDLFGTFLVTTAVRLRP